MFHARSLDAAGRGTHDTHCRLREGQKVSVNGQGYAGNTGDVGVVDKLGGGGVTSANRRHGLRARCERTLFTVLCTPTPLPQATGEGRCSSQSLNRHCKVRGPHREGAQECLDSL